MEPSILRFRKATGPVFFNLYFIKIITLLYFLIKNIDNVIFLAHNSTIGANMELIIVLIGLVAALVAALAYAYLDYMSGRHLAAMYSGIKSMIYTLKERMEILERTVKAMESHNENG